MSFFQKSFGQMTRFLLLYGRLANRIALCWRQRAQGKSGQSSQSYISAPSTANPMFNCIARWMMSKSVRSSISITHGRINAERFHVRFAILIFAHEDK